jgi:hypothetical protein
MIPPRRDGFDALVRGMIAENPGQTLGQLAASSGLFREEIVAAINTLGGAVEIRNDGRLYIRSRKPKTARPASLRDRLLDWLIG